MKGEQREKEPLRILSFAQLVAKEREAIGIGGSERGKGKRVRIETTTSRDYQAATQTCWQRATKTDCRVGERRVQREQRNTCEQRTMTSYHNAFIYLTPLFFLPFYAVLPCACILCSPYVPSFFYRRRLSRYSPPRMPVREMCTAASRVCCSDSSASSPHYITALDADPAVLHERCACLFSTFIASFSLTSSASPFFAHRPAPFILFHC